MPTINKTYTINNTTNLPVTKSAELIVNGVLYPSTITSTTTPTDTITISANVPNDDILSNILINITLDIEDTGSLCEKLITDDLGTTYNTELVSVHFRGELTKQVVEQTYKIYNLAITNVFNSCLNPRYKYANVHNVLDWSSYPYVSLSQLQSSILSGPNSYSIYVDVDGYTLGSDAGVCLRYNTQRTATPSAYLFQSISQDIVIYLDRKVTFSVVGSTPGMSLSYSLLPTNDPNNYVGSTLLNLTDLNTAISNLAANSQYAVQVWATYTPPTASGTGTFTNAII